MAGTVLLTVALMALLVPLTEGRAAGWPLWTWPALAVCPAAAYAFVRVERGADLRGRTPLVPPSLFALVSLRRGTAILVPLGLGFSGFMFVVAVALQRGKGLGPVSSGLALAPLAVAFFLASLAGPRLVARWGARVVTAGCVIQALGIALLAAFVHRDWAGLGVLALLPGTAVAGAGQGLQLPVLFRIIMSEVPPVRAGVGSGVMITAQQAALALGVATLGSLFLSLASSLGMRDALTATLLTQVAAIAVTAVLSLRLPRAVG